MVARSICRFATRLCQTPGVGMSRSVFFDGVARELFEGASHFRFPYAVELAGSGSGTFGSGRPSTSVADDGLVASPVKAGLWPPPTAADGLDRACHEAAVCHQGFDGRIWQKFPITNHAENTTKTFAQSIE